RAAARPSADAGRARRPGPPRPAHDTRLAPAIRSSPTSAPPVSGLAASPAPCPKPPGIWVASTAAACAQPLQAPCLRFMAYLGGARHWPPRILLRRAVEQYRERSSTTFA